VHIKIIAHHHHQHQRAKSGHTAALKFCKTWRRDDIRWWRWWWWWWSPRVSTIKRTWALSKPVIFKDLEWVPVTGRFDAKYNKFVLFVIR